MIQNWIANRDKLKLVIEATGIQIVHAFPRLEGTNHVGRTKEFMLTDDRIHAWTILRSGAINRYSTMCEIEVLHQTTVRGMLQHSDENATQDEFDAEIDTIMTALYPQLSLGGNATLQGPAQLPIEEFRIFAETVVHYAEITTVVNQTVMVTGKS